METKLIVVPVNEMEMNKQGVQLSQMLAYTCMTVYQDGGGGGVGGGDSGKCHRLTS